MDVGPCPTSGCPAQAPGPGRLHSQGRALLLLEGMGAWGWAVSQRDPPGLSREASLPSPLPESRPALALPWHPLGLVITVPAFLDPGPLASVATEVAALDALC